MQRLNALFAAGGIIMVPLIGFSIAVIAVVVERFAFWYRVKHCQHGVIREVLKLYTQDSELAIEKRKRPLDLPVARIFWEALSLRDANPEQFRLALEGAIQAELPLLKLLTFFILSALFWVCSERLLVHLPIKATIAKPQAARRTTVSSLCCHYSGGATISQPRAFRNCIVASPRERSVSTSTSGCISAGN